VKGLIGKKGCRNMEEKSLLLPKRGLAIALGQTGGKKKGAEISKRSRKRGEKESGWS